MEHPIVGSVLCPVSPELDHIGISERNIYLEAPGLLYFVKNVSFEIYNIRIDTRDFLLVHKLL